MSTKINVRSPFYLSVSEPAVPSIALTEALINLQGFEVDEYGNITLPVSDYGTILSYTSSAGDFSDGSFATVVTDTSRTVTFTMTIPPNFSNSDQTIDIDLTATQPATACTGGISASGSIPNQSINTDGDSVTIDLSSYFTGTTPTDYNITNNYLDFFTHSISGNDITIYGTSRAGTKNIYIEASDGNAATCNATQSIQITTTALETYDCNDAYFSGGSIAQDGTITDPTVNGTITAKSLTSGGAHITSHSANTTGSDRDVTLYFDITVPSGYSNAGDTFICDKTFSQPTSTLPTFTCAIASPTNQAVMTTGAINKGIVNVGTISGFSPISFAGGLSVDTERTITLSITPPASGYSNSGGSDITCDVNVIQPAITITPTAGTVSYFTGGQRYDFMTEAQFQAVDPSVSAVNLSYNTIEGALDSQGIYDPKKRITQKAAIPLKLSSSNFESLVNTYAFFDRGTLAPSLWNTKSHQLSPYNPTGGGYWRITKVQESGGYIAPAYLQTSYFMKLEPTGLITEIWLVDWYAPSFTKIT